MNELIARKLAERGRGSQTALATALNVRPQTVSKWVSGEITPEPERWSAIEEHLDLDPGALLQVHVAAVEGAYGPDVTWVGPDGVRHVLELKRPSADARIPETVQVALRTLGDELAQLRAEVAELRSEVRGSARSSAPVPPTRQPTPRRP